MSEPSEELLPDGVLGSENSKPSASSTESEKPDLKPLYRGVWVDKIKDGEQIPVGGSIFSDDLDIVLDVDTAWMDPKIETATKERLQEVYQASNGEKFKKLVNENGVKLDPETLHTLYQVQQKMRAILEVSDNNVAREREDLYLSGRRAKLSKFVGRAECAEQAVVGKLLLDRIGMKSTLMGGVHVDSKNNGPTDHTFLILDDPHGDGSLIFDIARPKASLNGFPRILRTNQKLEYSTFEGKNNYVVPATDVYNGTTLYYGVGHSSLLQDVNFADS